MFLIGKSASKMYWWMESSEGEKKYNETADGTNLANQSAALGGRSPRRTEENPKARETNGPTNKSAASDVNVGTGKRRRKGVATHQDLWERREE